MQEQDAWWVGNRADRTNAIYVAIKPTTSLPLTFSSIHKLTDNNSREWIESIKNSCDVLDFHIYKALRLRRYPHRSSPPTWIDGRRLIPTRKWQSGRSEARKVMARIENRAFVGSAFKLVGKDSRLRSCCLWAAQDQGLTADLKYGLFDAHWSPRYAFRTAIRQVTGGSVVRPH